MAAAIRGRRTRNAAGCFVERRRAGADLLLCEAEKESEMEAAATCGWWLQRRPVR
uniref:Uncharacterized protein n=1 Tax=Cucumis melo TaxID=3656 RepID=A0A9I9E3S1_CUCME